MTSAQIIERATTLAQENGRHVPLTRGMVAIHPSDPITATFDGYDGDEAILSWPDRSTKRFPRHEVCDVNLVKEYAIRLKFGMTVDPTIPLDDHETQLTRVRLD